MRRWATGAFLAVFVLFLAAMSYDCCGDHTPNDCPAACHLLCADSCTVVPTLTGPVPPPPDPLPRLLHEKEPKLHLVSLDIEPEKDPPRT